MLWFWQRNQWQRESLGDYVYQQGGWDTDLGHFYPVTEWQFFQEQYCVTLTFPFWFSKYGGNSGFLQLLAPGSCPDPPTHFVLVTVSLRNDLYFFFPSRVLIDSTSIPNPLPVIGSSMASCIIYTNENTGHICR